MSKISVRIPTLNNYEGLVRALDSILAQDFQDMDIIIIDNCSDDGSWSKTKGLQDRDARLSVRQNPIRGLGENWNACVESATADYVLIFHSDDEMLQGMIRKAVEFLDSHPSVGLVHSNCWHRGPTGKDALSITQTSPILRAGTESLIKVLSDNNLACSTVVVRRVCYQQLGVFLVKNPSPDWEMWARIVSKYDMGHIGEPLVVVYAHDDSLGRMAISKAPVLDIEQQWLMLGNKIVSYFPTKDHLEAFQGLKRYMTIMLNIAAHLAWKQKRWQRGQEFYRATLRHTTSLHWLSLYIKGILLVMKRSLVSYFPLLRKFRKALPL